MRLEHVAVWTTDLERLRAFYERYLGARTGTQYQSARRAGFSSYFLTFPDGGSRLELMSLPGLVEAPGTPRVGYAHIALAVGSRVDVEAVTERMRRDGVRVISAPRLTGDGYFESVVEDPDGNEVELATDA